MAGASKSSGMFMAVYKILRWVVLALLVLFIFSALRKPTPPAEPVAPENSKEKLESFNQKMDSLAASHSEGRPDEQRFDSDEVNSAIQNSMSGPPLTAAPAQTPAQPAPQATSSPAPAAPNSQLNAQSEVPEGLPVQTVQVGFLADQVIGQFSTKIYGKDVFITVAGKLGSKDGYVTFDPTAFKVGDLSVPVSLVNDALQRKLADPENHEKLKLPDYISSLRIEDGQLVITEK